MFKIVLEIIMRDDLRTSVSMQDLASRVEQRLNAPVQTFRDRNSTVRFILDREGFKLQRTLPGGGFERSELDARISRQSLIESLKNLSRDEWLNILREVL